MKNNYRTNSEYYHISSIKLLQINEYAKGAGHTDEEIKDYVLADWPEGQEHQDWLDRATVQEIGNWVCEGLRNQK